MRSVDTGIVSDELRRIYENSLLPAAVSGRNGLVYYNKAFEPFYAKLSTEFSSVHTGEAYDKYVYCDGRLYKTYVSPISSDESLVNIAPAASFSDDCFEVLNAAVRHAVSTVSAAADNLFELYETEPAAKLLSVIDSSMLTLMSEFLIPEEIMQLSGLKCSDFAPVSVSSGLTRLADELSEVLSRHNVHINANIASGMFARIDMRAVKLIFTDFAVKAMEGERHVEAIGLTLSRKGADRMLAKLTCGCIMRIPSELSSEAVIKPENYTPVEKLKAIVSGIFDCEISCRENADHCSVSIDIPMSEAPQTDGLRSPVKFYGKDRFSNENAYLSRLGINPKYINKR